VSLRVTRLDSTGNLLSGPTDSYTTTAFIRVSFTPEYEEGDEITEKAADGTVCISYKAPDTLKRVNMEIAICDPDAELTAMLSGGLLLSGKDSNDNEITQGWASAQVGEDPSGNGVAVETWSRAIQSGKAASSNPYFHWIFPYVKTRLSGDRVVENGLLATTFEGFGLGNINFRTGPDNGWRWPAATDRPYLYARTAWAPQGLRGFYQWTPGADATEPPTDTPGPTTFDTPVGINVPGAPNPYPYNSSIPTDFLLSNEDYLDDASGTANFPSSAASQDVKNQPPTGGTGLVQNPVTYLSRGDATGPAGPGLTGVTAGTPGTFQGGSAPANFTALQSNAVVGNSGSNKPTTAWTAGQYVDLGDASDAYWNGTAWVVGVAP
jgi:hypothetical protein